VIDFIIASRRSSTSSVEALEKSLKAIRPNDRLIVSWDSRSMARAYNDALKESTADLVVFTHNDVTLMESENWSDEFIADLFSDPKAGIMGVAGSREARIDGTWFVEGDPANSGTCHHKIEMKNGRVLATVDQYGDLGEVIILDGVFLMMRRSLVDELGGFDEESFGDAWHFYDFDISLRSHLAGYDNRTVPFEICHGSPGHLDFQWRVVRSLYVDKWEHVLPLSMKKEKA